MDFSSLVTFRVPLLVSRDRRHGTLAELCNHILLDVHAKDNDLLTCLVK